MIVFKITSYNVILVVLFVILQGHCFIDLSRNSLLRNHISDIFAWINPRSHIKFYLWTRSNLKEYRELKLRDLNSVYQSNFNGTRDTKIIIHGFANTGVEELFANLIDELLKAADVNVISVDWTDLAIGPFYHASLAHTDLVTEETVRLIRTLIQTHHIKPEQLHLLGFSLGAHIAGFIGLALGFGKVGRITGMDPAGPGFSAIGSPVRDRLHWSHAKYVDVIHTSAARTILKGAGIVEPLGHVDFYPNGGTSPQPGCWRNVTELLGYIGSIVCSHRKSVEFVTDSLQSNVPMRGCLCTNWYTYQSGECKCQITALMGVPSLTNSTRGIYFLRTNDREPFGQN